MKAVFPAAVVILYGLIAVIEKWLHHKKRMTRFYVVRENHGVFTVSHEPFGLYRQGRQAFFTDRARAYALIAESLPQHVHMVKSESVWIDYEREGWKIEEKPNTPIKRLTSIWFYWANFENWNREPGSSWHAIGNPTYRVATMSRKEFAARFGKGVE